MARARAAVLRTKRGWSALQLHTRLAIVISSLVTLLVIIGVTPLGATALRAIGVSAKASPQAHAATPTTRGGLGLAGGGGGPAQPCSQFATNSYAPYATTSNPYATYVQPPYATYTPPPYSTYVQPPYATYTPPQYGTYAQPPYSTYVQPPYSTYVQPPYATYTPPSYGTYAQPPYATVPC